jgi:hypothetical protein
MKSGVRSSAINDDMSQDPIPELETMHLYQKHDNPDFSTLTGTMVSKLFLVSDCTNLTFCQLDVTK